MENIPADLDQHELEASISRSKATIKEVIQWKNGEYQIQTQKLNDLEEELEAEIKKQEELQRLIRRRLREISALKAKIAENVPFDNHAKITLNQS